MNEGTKMSEKGRSQGGSEVLVYVFAKRNDPVEKRVCLQAEAEALVLSKEWTHTGTMNAIKWIEHTLRYPYQILERVRYFDPPMEQKPEPQPEDRPCEYVKQFGAWVGRCKTGFVLVTKSVSEHPPSVCWGCGGSTVLKKGVA
jgi:hypothetical protein